MLATSFWRCRKAIRNATRGSGPSADTEMTTATKRYPEGTAYHEAGHAIVAYALGLRVGDIHINEHDEGGGTEVCQCDASRSFIEQAALRLAGIKAQTLWKKPSTLPLGQKDQEKLLHQGRGLSDACREEIRMRGFELAGEKLERYEGKVKAVAEHLIEHGRMTESEFDAMMADA